MAHTIEAFKNEEVTMKCSAGNHTNQYWVREGASGIKGNDELSNHSVMENHQNYSYIFAINNINIRDEGNYTCLEIISGRPYVVSTVELTVIGVCLVSSLYLN